MPKTYYMVEWDEGGLDTLGCSYHNRDFNNESEAMEFAKGEALADLNLYKMSPKAKVTVSKCEIIATFEQEKDHED